MCNAKKAAFKSPCLFELTTRTGPARSEAVSATRGFSSSHSTSQVIHECFMEPINVLRCFQKAGEDNVCDMSVQGV